MVFAEFLGRYRALVAAAIFLCIALQAHLVFVQEVNWDEFLFLSFIHDHQRGTLGNALQTFHVLLFAWLPYIAAGEIAQIEAARLVVLAMEAATVALIVATGRAFLSKAGALTAALAYLSSGYVLLHGASFRADPIAAFLLMLCLWLLARSRLGWSQLLAIAACGALAMLVTVKSIFYLPAFAGVAYWRIAQAETSKALLLRLAAAAAASAVIFGLLYLGLLSTLPQSNVERSVSAMSSAYRKTFLWSDLFPRIDTLVHGAVAAPVQSFLLVAGIALAVVGLFSTGGERPKRLALLMLAAPLASFILYRNAFPYFLAFILPPAAVLAGLASERFLRSRLLFSALPLLMLASAAVVYARSLDRPRTAQEETVALVHRLFPDPVPYIDRCSMIGSFPKHGFFMSSWGLENYRARGVPVFASILQETAPHFVLANSPALASSLRGSATGVATQGLFERDAALLRSNYVHHWGALWVAGKRLDVEPRARRFELLIPGIYTLEASSRVGIDGRTYAPGAVLRLNRGRHEVAAQRPGTVVLRWGDRLPRPSKPPSQTPIFWGF